MQILRESPGYLRHARGGRLGALSPEGFRGAQARGTHARIAHRKFLNLWELRFIWLRAKDV